MIASGVALARAEADLRAALTRVQAVTAGSAVIQSLGFIPLIMPPFVGAVAMTLLFGRNGTVNRLLNDWFGFRGPFMEGLNGVIFVQPIHSFPFILITLSASLRNTDRLMEEAGRSSGFHRRDGRPDPKTHGAAFLRQSSR